jgi:hypothetical protein
MANRRQVSIFINGKEVENQIKSITAAKYKLNAELNRMTVGTQEYSDKVRELRRVNGILDEHRNNIKGVETGWQKLAKGGITKLAGLAAGAFAVSTIVEYGRELFNLGTQMDLLQRKASTVFGNTLPQVTAAAKENATAMGLTNAEYITAAASIGDLLIPMKFQREEAAQMSVALVDLSGALSEWTGGQIDAENVARILSKAVLGEREELKQLGISILESDVTARLAEKGLKNLTGAMLQQAKAVATLELITEKSLDAQTAFANNADLSARKQAELSARIKTVAEQLAATLIPVFNRLVSVAEAAASGIEAVADFIGKIVDPAAAATEAFREQESEVNNLEKSFVPLLNRYDELTKKGSLNKDEQQELNTIIEKISKTVPSAVTEFDKYGNALAINTDRAREFVRVQQLMLAERNRTAITEQQQKLSELQDEYRQLSQVVLETDGAFANVQKVGGEYFERIIKGGQNSRIELKKLGEEEVGNLINRFGELQRRIEGTQAVINDLSGKPITPTAAGPSSILSPTQDEILAQAAAAEILRKQREEQAKRELKERISQQEELAKALAAFQQEAADARLTDDELALEKIRRRYQKEIDLAIALERKGVKDAAAARLTLEDLRDKELLLLTLQQNQDRYEAEIAQREEQEADRADRELAFQEARAQAIRDIQEITREVVLGDQELAMIQLEEQYNQLIDLANQYGVDTLDIEITRRRELERIRKEFENKEIKETAAQQQQLAQSYATAYSSVASVIGAAVDLIGDKNKQATALQKVLTLAQIALNSAAAISSAVAAGAAAGPFPANLAAIATGVATVLGNMAQARQVFASTPQFAKGGYVKAKGADDGRTYNARYIGQAPTGMLPNAPTLIDTSIGPVLGSERGREYFVNNKALRNPQVMNYVQAIDNIVKYKQFAGGGFTQAEGQAGGGANLGELTQATATLTAAVGTLVDVLQRPIYARIDDDTVIDIRDQLNKIVAASGGVA